MTPDISDEQADASTGDDLREFTQYHRDGTVWARGQKHGDVAEGYWQWFRKDGTLMRSGTFTAGEQIGEWTTYDKSGDPYKVTTITAKA